MLSTLCVTLSCVVIGAVVGAILGKRHYRRKHRALKSALENWEQAYLRAVLQSGKLDAAQALLEANGCDCECGCDGDGHLPECEPCLACRLGECLASAAPKRNWVGLDTTGKVIGEVNNTVTRKE